MMPDTLSPISAQIVNEHTVAGQIVSPGSRIPESFFGRAANAAKSFSRKRRPWALISFMAVVIFPTLIVLLYSLFVQSPQYQSEFRVSVRMAERMQSTSMLPSILGLGLSQSVSDSNAVAQYLMSHGVIDDLNANIDLKSIYAKSSIDWFSRLSKNSSPEALLRYWKWLTEAYFETSTETVVVRVTGFTPDDAVSLANRTLLLSEALVNHMSARAREDSVAVARRQVEEAQANLVELREKVKTLREKENLLDPRKEAEADLTVATKIREEISRAEADLSTMRSSMNDDAPSIKATKNRISALRSEFDRVVSSTVNQSADGRALSKIFGAFEQIDSDRMFAEKAYQAALSSLQSAEVDASRQQLYLATIVKPNIPQEPAYPRPFHQTLLVFTLAFAFWMLCSLVLASIRDHR